jgi:hypothetical protein
MDVLETAGIESFKGTLAFARLVILMLFIASLFQYNGHAVIFALLCGALAYVSQMLFTMQKNTLGYGLQLASALCWVFGLVKLLTTPYY